ncbi:melanoma-associated antigen B1-like [Ctenodactylus gundi]
MPRGQKSKQRARERRRQAQHGSQSLQDVRATEIQEEESPSCSSPASGNADPSSSAAGPPQKGPGPTSTTLVDVAASARASGKGTRSRGKSRLTPVQDPIFSNFAREELVMRKTGEVLRYILHRYKLNKPIRKRDMLKIVRRMFQELFPEVFHLACEHLHLLYGLELKEDNPGSDHYGLVSVIDLPNSENPGSGFPKNGILPCILGIVSLNKYSCPEEKIWRLLNSIGFFEEVEHFIFGDVRKLITQDLVQEKYVEYRQVPGSDPPRYEFLWGPRAYSEINLVKLQQFVTKHLSILKSDSESQS